MIENRILKQGVVEWRDLEWLQPKNFKELSKKNYERLKNSIRNNGFIDPFKIWIDGKGHQWILDGHHRRKVMVDLETEGMKIPDVLAADFIDCKDKKEAMKFVLIYSAIYAKPTYEGIDEILTVNDISVSDVFSEVEIPNIDIEYFNSDDDKKKIVKETTTYCPYCGREIA